MTPADLIGVSFGPIDLSLSTERATDYVEATSDDPDRWNSFAPPGFASVLLFAVAGDFLWDPRIAAHTKTLLHLDQAFRYSAPFVVGSTVTVSGEVTRVREREGAFFVTFEAVAVDAGDDRLVATSTFLMSSEPAADPGPDDGEPPASGRGDSDTPRHLEAVVGEPMLLAKSASRADLVRYASATKDFNPIHWDHEAARAGGAPGVIVHGLLMLAWAAQAAGSISSAPDPVAHMKVRFRSPLRPCEQAHVEAVVRDTAPDERDTQVGVRVLRGADVLVTGEATVRLSQE